MKFRALSASLNPEPGTGSQTRLRCPVSSRAAAQDPQDARGGTRSCLSPVQGPRVESADARPDSRLPNPHHNRVHFHNSFPCEQVSKSKRVSYARWALSGKTQKNLIFGPEAVDCGRKSAAKTINLCRVPQLARVVKKIIPQQNQ